MLTLRKLSVINREIIGFGIQALFFCLLLTAAFVCPTSACKRRWCQYRMPLCLDESSALTTWSSQSLHACVFKASGSPDDLVLQWNRQTGVCALFRYQRVCGAMRASGAEPIGAGGAGGEPEAPQCSLYRSMSLASCSASVDARLIGVWLAGGPAANRFTNLVCQSGAPTAAEQRLESAGLQWTEEGARFDGQSSYALLNDSRFASDSVASATGFTWLMRLKRQPRIQPFMQLVSCSNFYDIGPFWAEFPSVNQLYLGSSNKLAQKVNMHSSLEILPGSASSWVNMAVVIGANASSSKFFVGSSFDSNTTRSDAAVFNPLSCPMFLIGRYQDSNVNYTLQGTVSAIGVANSSLSEQQIREFFSQLP